MTPNWLIQRAYLTPNKIALSINTKQWTFLQLKEEAMMYARKLRANGMREGDRIALIGNSNEQMVFVIHGCLLAGLEVVMLNNRLSKKELDWQLNDSSAHVVIVADEFVDLFIDTSTQVISFSELARSEEKSFQVTEVWSADRTITIMYTSGTTGYPKGVRQTAGNHTSSALSSVLNLGLDENDVWLCTMPLFHISGFSILVRSVLYGMTVRLYEKFDVDKVTEEIRLGSVTRISVVTLMLQKILLAFENSKTIAHETFKTMLAGGGSIPVDYLERAKVFHIPVLQTYGMTETSSQTATLSVADSIRKIGSAGKPLFFNQIKIKDAKDAFDKGEVLIRGPHVTPGYIGHFAEKSPLENGWLPTGDIGYFDEEGYLYIVDRRSDLIISGGENIYPAEIENVLSTHPKITEVGVCGKVDSDWGSVPVAFVVVNEPLIEESLKVFCTERLARYKVPKAFYFVDELPRNASNKLLRRELKKWLE